MQKADLRAEAERLIREGKMPSLDEVLRAVAETRLKYRNAILQEREIERGNFKLQ